MILQENLVEEPMFIRFAFEGRKNASQVEVLLRTVDPVVQADLMPKSFLEGGELRSLLNTARQHLLHNPNHPAGQALKKLSQEAMRADIHLFFAAFRNPTGCFVDNPILKPNGQFRSQKEFVALMLKSNRGEILKTAFLFVVLGQHFVNGGTIFMQLNVCFSHLTLNYSCFERSTAKLWVSSGCIR